MSNTKKIKKPEPSAQAIQIYESVTINGNKTYNLDDEYCLVSEELAYKIVAIQLATPEILTFMIERNETDRKIITIKPETFTLVSRIELKSK